VYGKLASIKVHQNEGTERLMIGNIPELQVVTLSEVVVGEVGTAAFEFLAVAPFAIHVALVELVLKVLLSALYQMK
jgi:hypothetical protein